MATTLTSSAQLYAPELAVRVGIIVATLRTAVGRGLAGKVPLHLLGAPLCSRLSRILKRFTDLMDRLAAGRLPRQRSGPHTGGAPHPENLSRGSPFSTRGGWLALDLGAEAAALRVQLQAVLAEPLAKELFAQVPAAGRILRPICRMLGVGRFDPYLAYAREAAEKSAAWASRGPAACLSRRPDRPSRRDKAILLVAALGLGRKSDPPVASPPRSPADAPLKCMPFRAARPPVWWYGADPAAKKPP